MATARIGLSLLTAGVSTRANLISYWNANMAILDYATMTLSEAVGEPSLVSDVGQMLHLHAGTNLTAFGVDAVAPYSFWIQSKNLNNNGTTYPMTLNPLGGFVGINTRRPRSTLDVQCRGVAFNDGLNITKSDFTRVWSVIMTSEDGLCFGESDDGIAFTNEYILFSKNGDVSAKSYTDRTPAFVGDALSLLRKIRATGNGEIDHATLPEFAIEPYSDVEGEYWPGRNIGNMMSMFLVGIQQLVANYEAAVAERDKKIEALANRIEEIAAKIPLART
jgi:hypothetical protein